MKFDLLIKGGEVWSSSSREVADVGIADGKIVQIGHLNVEDAAEVLDAAGLAVFPGVIDTQVHFREPGMEHKEDIESGTRSAVMGGVTTVFEMPNTKPPTTSEEALADKLDRAKGRAWCNIAFFVGAAMDNTEELARLETLPGTPGVKIFMGSSTGTLLVPDDDNLRGTLRNGKFRCPVHAEDHARLEARKSLLSAHPSALEHPFLRDAECARLATERILRLSAETGRPVHILHVSTADELPLIGGAKRSGLNVTAEVTPQHLWFEAPDCYERLGTLAQMNPPVRDRVHRDAIRQAVRDGLFDVFGSDHAPHTLDEKQLPYPQSPSGMPGVQTLLPVLLTLGKNEHMFDVHQFIRMACEAPAQIYGVRHKGFVREGYDADLALIDLSRTETVEKSWLQSKCGWSPYEGERLTGWPVHTVVRGQVAVRDCRLNGVPREGAVRFDRA